MRALVIMPEPMHRILDGPKSWEIRRGRCLIRELIGLIESGSGMVVGVAELTDCIGPLTRELRIRNARKMGITVADASERWATDYYAWVLRKRRRLRKPVPYAHPNGVVRWVPLSVATEAAVRRQLKSGG
jgi:hypothetical protein